MTTNVQPIASAAAREARSIAAPRATPSADRPWYRAEPWVVPTLAAFFPLIVGHWLPEATIRPMLALGGALMLLGIGMLLKQGLFRSAGDPARSAGR